MNSRTRSLSTAICLAACIGLPHLPAVADRQPDATDVAGKRPLDFASDQVTSLAITFPNDTEPVILERSDAGEPFDFAGDGTETADAAAVDELLRILLEARIEAAHPLSDEDAIAARERPIEFGIRHTSGTEYTLRIGRRPAETDEPNARPPRVEASIVFDQDGNIVELPETEPEPENQEPGPVFIEYDSDDPDFPWSRVSESVTLSVADTVFEALPGDITELVEARPARDRDDRN